MTQDAVTVDYRSELSADSPKFSVGGLLIELRNPVAIVSRYEDSCSTPSLNDTLVTLGLPMNHA